MITTCAFPEEPNLNWTLEQLETYITTAIKRTAIDAWRLGKALKCARRKVNEAKKQTWTQWKRAHNYSDTMVSRYIRLYESYESTDALGDLGVIEACEKAGILTPRGKAAPQSEDKHQPEQDGPYAWAMHDGDDDELVACLADLDDCLGSVLASGDQELLRTLVALPDFQERLGSVRKRLDVLAEVIAAVPTLPTRSSQTELPGPTLAV